MLKAILAIIRAIAALLQMFLSRDKTKAHNAKKKLVDGLESYDIEKARRFERAAIRSANRVFKAGGDKRKD